MVNMTIYMLIADVIMIFVAFTALIVLTVYRLVAKKYGMLERPANMQIKFKVKNKSTGESFSVYDTHSENSTISFMIYIDKRFEWVTSSEYEPIAH